MPATDHRIDGYPFSYPVAIDVVAYRVDDTEKFMAYDTGIFCKGIMSPINMTVGTADTRQFHFNTNFTRRRLRKRARFDS